VCSLTKLLSKLVIVFISKACHSARLVSTLGTISDTLLTGTTGTTGMVLPERDHSGPSQGPIPAKTGACYTPFVSNRSLFEVLPVPKHHLIDWMGILAVVRNPILGRSHHGRCLLQNGCCRTEPTRESMDATARDMAARARADAVIGGRYLAMSVQYASERQSPLIMAG